MQERVSALREQLAEAECDAYFSFNSSANEYLTGFRGSTSALFVSADKACFLCDFRYTEQANETVQTFAVDEITGSLEKAAGRQMQDLGLKRAAFDPSVTSVAQRGLVADVFEGELVADATLLAALRQVKDATEIAKVRAANDLAEGVLRDLLPDLKAGVIEREFAARMEYEFKVRGAQGPSFDPIVLFGSRSSLPHGMPGGKRLEDGDVVLLDFGCIRESYCSDLTRTFVFSTIPGSWFEEIYAVTLRAQLAALEAVHPGAKCAEVDAVARDIIDEAGFGEYFGHGLGHGVGLDVHEGPRLNKQSEAILKAGMVVTVEPGIYLPGQGGVRIEDLVVVTDDGCDVLSRTPKELKVL